MKISLAQIDIIWEDKEKNKEKCLGFIKKAKDDQAKMVIFPEMTLTGFSMNVDALAEVNNETVKWFEEKAKEFGIYIGFGYIEKASKKGLNNFSIVSPAGIEMSKYTKIHPFSFGNEPDFYEAGNNVIITEIEGVKLATFICYDLRFPEIFQVASHQAQVIIVIANWPEARKEHWITLLKARAIENQCYIIGVNRFGESNGLKYSGDSMVIDPLGSVVAKCPNDECILSSELDLNLVESVRNNFKLKEDRKEHLYIRELKNKRDTGNHYFKRSLLTGQNVIVTGACGLIGREICNSVAEFGGNIVIADINEEVGKGFSENLKKKYSVKTLFFPLDINSEASVNELISTMQSKSLSIDGLVNCAYPRNKTYGTIYEEISLMSWRENIDLHLNGYFNITQKISKIMMNQKSGSIINLSSIYGILGPDFSIYEGTRMTNPAEYSAIKGAIINFTRYLTTYLAKYNIRVNSISPGGIFDNQAQAFVEKYSRKTPLGRMGNPEEIAGGVVFLLSELASFITGHNLVIDGGWSTW